MSTQRDRDTDTSQDESSVGDGIGYAITIAIVVIAILSVLRVVEAEEISEASSEVWLRPNLTYTPPANPLPKHPEVTTYARY